mmetsp:Transcript_103571/g.231356  ORF Transcript_103571/g.231356 Transcript_103571/m.231356 type:complete len:440 (+) Transcript_103571:3-1322(+)
MGMAIVARRRRTGSAAAFINGGVVVAAPQEEEEGQDAAVEEGNGEEVDGDELTAADAPRALRALQRLDLPFFATSASKVDRPLQGVKLCGNLRSAVAEGGVWGEAQVGAVKERLEAELGRTVSVHLLRSQEDGDGGDALGWELFVTAEKVKEEEEALSTEGLALSLGSLAATFGCAQALGSVAIFQAEGAAVVPGSALPVGLLLGLLAFAEGARRAVARTQGVALGLPVFLPSPQLGVLGVFSDQESGSASSASTLALALSRPLSIVVASLCLLAISVFSLGTVGEGVSLRELTHIAWPVASLPTQCDALLWAGTHGLLMAGYALLPHSPDGQMAWSCLIGRERARKLSEAMAYIHPFLGIATVWGHGQGWQALPLWWAFLLINFTPAMQPPPREELSEVPLVARAGAALTLFAAVAVASPYPLPVLSQELAALLGGAA